MKQLPYAEDVGHYWKTSQTSADAWIDSACKVIEDMGGKVEGHAYGQSDGRGAFMLRFSIEGQSYRVVWPILPLAFPSPASERATRIQAATMLYHDVKAKAMTAAVLGERMAFFSYMELSDGHVAGEIQNEALAEYFPKMLMGAKP